MIEINGLHKTFGENEVLRGIDLTVSPGSVVAVLGPSGAGKSTLLRCINLLERPDAGKIRIDDLSLDYRHFTKQEMYMLRRKTSMVFQSYNLFAHRTALANVMEGLVIVQKMPVKEAEEAARAELAKVGLADKADAWPTQLSGGQQQRVAIARAVVMRPKVILFDEPTSALDPELVQEVLQTMRLVASEGHTMIVVTHELAFARDAASDIVFLAEGKILEKGPTGEFFSNPKTERAKAFLQQYSPDYGFQI